MNEQLFDFDDLLIGDKNAIMIAARVLGYGKDYTFNYNGEEITAQICRFGPYLKAGSLNVSLKDQDPFTITEKTANELIKEHQKKLDERVIATFQKEGIQVLNGRYGPYVTDGKINATIPKDVEPKSINL